MLKRAWRWVVGEPEVSERLLLLEAIRALREQSSEQNKTFQQWLSMFSAQAAGRPVGWTADDHAVAVKELAQERGLRVPDELLAASEQERINWLQQQMDDESW